MSVGLIELSQSDQPETRSVNVKVIDLVGYIALRKSSHAEVDLREQVKLTPIQSKLLELISLGNSTAQSGFALGYSMPYMKNLRAELPRNLGANNINHAIRVGFERGILAPLEDELEFGYYYHPLTSMQLKILQLTSLGKSKNEIGELFGIQPKTAKNHNYAIRYNLGASNTSNAVRIGIISGLIPINTDSRI